MKPIHENTVIAVLLIVALLPAMALRDFTPDNELRYLSIADEALRNGHLFAFYNQGAPYADKPPLYLWIVMLGKWMLGRHAMLFLSLFSVIPALVIMRVMDTWTAAYVRLSATTRLTGQLMLMTTGLFLGMALTIRMDMLMCMFIVLSLHTFYRLYSGQGRRGDRLLFPLYIFLGIFTKGPVAFLVPLVSIPVFLLVERKGRTLGRYWGWRTWGVLLLLCAAWFGGVYLEGGQSYLDNLLFNQTVHRAVDSFHHKAPFYYYAGTFWYSVAPWCLLIVYALLARRQRGGGSEALERFYIVVALTTFVLLSVVSSKIAVYLLPAFPFFVYIAVIDLEKRGATPLAKAAVALPAAIFVAALPAVAYMALSHLFPAPWLGIVAAAVLTLCGGATLYTLYVRHDLRRAIRTMAVGLLLTVFVGGGALPALNDRIGFEKVCREAQTMAATHHTRGYVTYGIRRPESMDVFLHVDVQSVEADALKEGRCKGVLLMAKKRRLERDDELCRLLAGHPQKDVGDYLIVAL